MMKIYRIGNMSINIYLLDSGTHRLLVDSGYPDTLNELGREMRTVGFKIREIDFLIVTHFHIDHAGAIQELKNQGVQFVLFDIQQDFIKPMEEMSAGKWRYTPLKRNDHTILPLKDSREFLSRQNIGGQIIATPGHSDDSISLLLDSGDAFTGDLMAEDLTMDENVAAKQSWQNLRQLGARRVYPGHGMIFDL
jgi:endoribonuclease LACTB2